MHKLDAESRELCLVVSQGPPELWYAERSECLTNGRLVREFIYSLISAYTLSAHALKCGLCIADPAGIYKK